MKQDIFINVTPEELKALVKDAVKEATQEKTDKELMSRTYSINGTAKLLNRSFETIKKMIQSGKLPTIDNGKRITAHAINNYLKEGN